MSAMMILVKLLGAHCCMFDSNFCRCSMKMTVRLGWHLRVTWSDCLCREMGDICLHRTCHPQPDSARLRAGQPGQGPHQPLGQQVNREECATATDAHNQGQITRPCSMPSSLADMPLGQQHRRHGRVTHSSLAYSKPEGHSSFQAEAADAAGLPGLWRQRRLLLDGHAAAAERCGGADFPGARLGRHPVAAAAARAARQVHLVRHPGACVSAPRAATSRLVRHRLRMCRCVVNNTTRFVCQDVMVPICSEVNCWSAGVHPGGVPDRAAAAGNRQAQGPPPPGRHHRGAVPGLLLRYIL